MWCHNRDCICICIHMAADDMLDIVKHTAAQHECSEKTQLNPSSSLVPAMRRDMFVRKSNRTKGHRKNISLTTHSQEVQ